MPGKQYYPFSTNNIPPQEQPDDGGFCLDGADVALACTAGTPLGEKLIQAFSVCFEGEDEMVAEGRRGKGKQGCRGRKCKGKGKKGCRGRKCKGKGKKPKPSCPSVDNILEKMELDMESK